MARKVLSLIDTNFFSKMKFVKLLSISEMP